MPRGLSTCLPEVNLTFLVVSPPDRGRRVLLGAAAPRSTPFHPPPATPLALVFAWTSLWPGQFLRKTDACHKPLGNRHHAHPSKNACSPNGLQYVMFPGEVLRKHGASSRAGSWRRAAVARKADRLSQVLLPLSRCAGCSKGESSAIAGNFPKHFSRTRSARHSACCQLRSARRKNGRLEEPGTRHGGFSQKPNGTGCDEWGRPERKGWSGGMEGGAGGETQFPITRPPSPVWKTHH